MKRPPEKAHPATAGSPGEDEDMRGAMLLVAGLCAMAMVPATEAGNWPASMTMAYRHGAAGETVVGAGLWADAQLPCHGIGGACFYAPGEAPFRLAVADASGKQVAAWWGTWSSNPLGPPTASGTFCGDSGDGLVTPAGTRAIAVAVRGPVGALLQCGPDAGTATEGKVTFFLD